MASEPPQGPLALRFSAFFHSEEILCWFLWGQPTNTAGIPKVQSLQLDFFFLFLRAKCLLCEPQCRTGGNREALALQ